MQSRKVLIVVASIATLAAMYSFLGRRFGLPHHHPSPVEVASPSPVEPRAAEIPPEVHEFLRNGQAWRAARRMRQFLQSNPAAGPEAVLLAARAEAGWGGWERTREYLEGRPWLDAVAGGEGWYWLGRALERDEEWDAALSAYEQYLNGVSSKEITDQHRIAQLRRGLILLRRGRTKEGTVLLERIRGHVPELTAWVNLLAAEALARTGDTATVRRLVTAETIPEARRRGQQARLAAYEEAGDPRSGAALARSFAEGEEASTRASLLAQAARLVLEARDSAQALEDLRSAVRAAPGSSGARAAADLLREFPDLSWSDRLALARVWDRHGVHRRAIVDYRAWLAAGEGSAEERNEVRFDLGQALFDSGEYGAAEEVLRPFVDGESARAARALYLTARAQYRSGERSRALGTFRKVAQRFPGSELGSQALFLIADLSHDAQEVARAKQLYRQVASDFPGKDRAGLSLMRLGGVEYLEGDYAAAAAAWEEYRSSYPRGERWLQSTYWAARAYEASGDSERARALYRAVREREPMSYYALQASERLQQPFWPIPLASSPQEDSAASRRVRGWMHGVDLLREAGLHAEAEAEVDRWIRRAGSDTALLYSLAEALNERGYSLEGIRIGLRLQREAEKPNERLLRILYPFPYRAMVAAEAREKGLDPFLVAALTRQESLFKARITSGAGARGLMQIMPQTGALLARAVDIRPWDAELLYQPEINVHLGTRYLAEQMERYDGSLPSVFSAYNAGPHRVERWKEFPEYGNEELFTERIPYRETRDYVKILTRNIALYRALYGEKGSGTQAD